MQAQDSRARRPPLEIAPPVTAAGRHGMSPELRHDDIARFNFLANFNKFLATRIVGGVRISYERRARPKWQAKHGSPPADRHQIRAAMRDDPYFRMWSALRRNAMEMRQQAGRSVVLRQAISLRDRAREANADSPTLQLDPAIAIPRYQSAVDNHCMPGSYYAEYFPDDVSAAANYDTGMFVTTTGLFGRYLDGAGRGIVAWLERERPGWQPRRILDLGCGLGHNTVPLARAFAAAQVIAVDVAAPMLRYGHARARSMGVTNIVFRQANAESLPFETRSFDFIYSTMFLHETSHAALRNILRETHRLLAPGGLHIHLEQPPYHGMSEFEKFLRDWDCYYNNEPFWTTLHDTRLPDLLRQLGFERDRIFETQIAAVVDEELPKVANEAEDYGRGGVWYAVGSERPS
ncbi:MAG: class I SAM-dependent methyltransferase [Steroidobacteraceae bacterium]|nr:class I SAM-dependent methyltransferase [Steroidobacteraceae bacterium]MDW8259768.1 class I SAM-dependent methyltransferase [Gammaproteobacteria bacterium]